jgi:serine protease Do
MLSCNRVFAASARGGKSAANSKQKACLLTGIPAMTFLAIPAASQAIGVNNATSWPPGGSVGIAVDTPAFMVNSIVAQLRSHGRFRRGWRGIELQPVTREMADSLGLNEATGALVANMEARSPAAEAGLASGDLITEVDGTAIKDARDLARTIGAREPGGTITLTIRRHGKAETMTVKLGTAVGTWWLPLPLAGF